MSSDKSLIRRVRPQDGGHLEDLVVPGEEHYEQGRCWIDLYDVKSGKRLVAFTGRYWGREATEIFDAAICDRYFAFPLTSDLRALFCAIGIGCR